MQLQSKGSLDMAAGHVIAWGHVSLHREQGSSRSLAGLGSSVSGQAGHLTHEDVPLFWGNQ